MNKIKGFWWDQQLITQHRNDLIRDFNVNPFFRGDGVRFDEFFYNLQFSNHIYCCDWEYKALAYVEDFLTSLVTILIIDDTTIDKGRIFFRSIHLDILFRALTFWVVFIIWLFARPIVSVGSAIIWVFLQLTFFVFSLISPSSSRDSALTLITCRLIWQRGN